MGLVLYLIYTADFPSTEETFVATYADNTAILAFHTNLDKIQNCSKNVGLWKTSLLEEKHVL